MRANLLRTGVWIVWMLASAGLVHAQSWNEVRPEGGRYSVSMPGKAEASTQDVPLPDGRKVTMYQSTFETPKAAYLSTHVDYPADAIKDMTTETILNNVRDGSAKGHKVRIEQRITIAGHPAREYVIEQAGNLILVTRSVFIGRRLYQIIVVGYAGIDSNPDTRKFLESFALR